MSKRESKKQHILQAGLEVMKARGYNGTSVKDIVDAAAVPKGSFYNYFASKEVFAVEALEAVAAEDYRSSRALMSAGELAPLARLQHYFEVNKDKACASDFRIGCFFGNMCQEMSDSSEAIRRRVKAILKRNTQLFQALLDEAKAAGDLPPEADTESMAEFIMNAWEGTLMRMKAAKSSEPLDAFLKTLPQLIT